MPVTVRARYVDGTLLEGTPEAWQGWPGEGIDWIEVDSAPGRTRISGQSVYWLYPEGRTWVAGGAPAGYGDLRPEIIVTAREQTARDIRFMPDLPLSAVKLGHWWPGTQEPIDG